MERVRTRKVALTRVIELLSGLRAIEELALVHTHAPEEAEELARRAHHLIPGGVASLSAEVTPVIGTHSGPGPWDSSPFGREARKAGERR